MLIILKWEECQSTRYKKERLVKAYAVLHIRIGLKKNK